MKNKSKKLIGIGQKFKNKYSGERYVLARIAANNLRLIGLNGGNRWSDTEVIVNDSHDVSKDEWDKLTSGQPREFTRCR